MRDPNRVAELARAAHAYTKDRVLPLERSNRDSIAVSPVDQANAKEKLVVQRRSSIFYKDPSKSKRNIFKSKKEKDAIANPDNWTFNKGERYIALDQQVRQGGAVGLAQAILSSDLADPLNVDIGFTLDDQGNAVSTGKPNGWLDLVAARNDVLYIRLLVGFGASPGSRDNALRIALEAKALDAVQELLRSDANPNAAGAPSHFLDAIAAQNKRLIFLFLSATVALQQNYINQALVVAIGRDSDIVALLIAHGADGTINNGEALCAAIRANSLQDTAMILSNPDGELLRPSLDAAIEIACTIPDETTKVRYLDLILSSGASIDTSLLSDQLLEAVEKHQSFLLKLLINHGTSPDRNDAECLRLAVVMGNIELVQIILQGAVSETSTSRALDEANVLEVPDVYEEIITGLVEKGVQQSSLSKCLADSVEKGSASLVPMLIEKGATLDYDNAQCVRYALKHNDFGLFGRLLEGPCQPKSLCNALPDAMAVQPRSERFEIVTQLLQKGVAGAYLHKSLQSVAGDAKDPSDYSLIQAFLRNNASVDFHDEGGNCIRTAAAQLDERALDLLCQGKPSVDTVSSAISALPVSFTTSEADEYEIQVRMLVTLLEHEAVGTPVAEMLITAVQSDHREKALKALIHHRANANYKHGKAIEEALRLPKISALELICKGLKIEKQTFEAQIPNALKPHGFDLNKASLLAHTLKAAGHDGVLNQPLLTEVEANGSREEVIKLLLSLGASVDFQKGAVLQHAVHTGQVEVCHLLLSAGPKKSTIKTAFPWTSENVDKGKRYNLMQALLQTGQESIGQDQALVQAAHEATPNDLSHVELLLQHGASADFRGGAAVLESVQARNLPLLKRFMKAKPNTETLSNAFNLTRKIECTKEERYDLFETILQVNPDAYELGHSLIEAVARDPYDKRTSTLLLSHGATVEAEDGLAIQYVASNGSLELLNIFLGKEPKQICRDAAFHAATHAPLNPEQRIQTYHSLLKTSITQSLISAALLVCCKDTTVDHTLVSLLIESGASLDFGSGIAMHEITAKGDISTLAAILQGKILEPATLDRSFSTAMTLQATTRLPIAKALLEKEPGVRQQTVSHYLAQVVGEKDHDLLALLMEYKPDPSYHSGESLIASARAGNATATELLAKAELSKDTVNQAFEQLLATRAIQSEPDGLRTAGILLPLGVSEDLVNRALLDGFQDPVNQLTKDLVDLLVPYGPNVSGGDGKAFVVAAGSGEVELFKFLASQKPDLNIVIPSLIRANKDEEELIPFLVHLEEHAGRGSDVLNDVVIFTALAKFPKGVRLVQHLLNHGCPAKSKTEAELIDIDDKKDGSDEGGSKGDKKKTNGTADNTQTAKGATQDESEPVITKETMTLLVWALSRKEPAIGEEVILEILSKEAEVEPSFETSETHTSATILASASGQNTILKILIGLDVDSSHRNAGGHSALFYASSNGHKETVKLLIQAGANPDDGSLQEAGRKAYPEIIELLLASGHRTDFPSSLHANADDCGRTALEELCLKATPGEDAWEKRIHRSIGLLHPGEGTDIAKSGGKTMLHLALENDSSVDVTCQLLMFPNVWENINHPIHIYKDTQSFYYSPTKYVQYFLSDTAPEIRQELTAMLRARKCKDRFYAHTVEQPDGAVGLPDDIAAAVEKQKRADHELQEEIKRRNAVAEHQRKIEAEDYARNLSLAKQRHTLLMKQLKEQEASERQMAQDKQATAVRHAQDLERQNQAALAEANQMRVQGLMEEAERRRRMAEAEQAAELAHQRSLAQQEYTTQKSKMAYEQQLITARDNASRVEYDRQVKLLERRDESVRLAAQAARSNGNY